MPAICLKTNRYDSLLILFWYKPEPGEDLGGGHIEPLGRIPRL